jgi:hydroxymethylglutaryl-CoA synthase
MVGVRAYGAYIPLYRLDRGEIAKAWRSPFPVPGEKAVANYDEDSLTMACFLLQPHLLIRRSSARQS